MEAVRLIFEDAPEKLSIPQSFQHKPVEVIFLPINTDSTLSKTSDDSLNINNACGILDASYSVSIEEMNQTIKAKGANL